MPLSKLQFRPGINRETTNYGNEGGFYACDKIRFRSGNPEKIGGWQNESYSLTYNGVAKSLWNWVTFNNENLLGIGTNQRYYIQNSSGGFYRDITPLRTTNSITNPFSTTSGSKLVTVNHTAHGATVNSFVTFSGATAVGGLTISGEYEIVYVTGVDSYQILAASTATSTAGPGGGTVTAAYQLNAGSVISSSLSGWGAGNWGIYPWGNSATVTDPVRLWSQDNFEQNLLLNPAGGPIYYWTKDVSTYNRAITLGAKSNTVELTRTTGTSAGAGTTITVADSTFIDIGSVVISGTNIATPGTDYVTAINGNVITLSAATTGAASGTYVFSYAGRFVPNNTSFVIASDTSHFTIALGANPYDPTNSASTYDPMLVRWSDQDNPFDWVPKTTNQSGEQHLANGSYLVAAQNTRQEILVWSDAALFSMQYLGPPYVWGFNLLMDNITIASPNSMTTVNATTYWMGMDKFFMYNGTVSTLPCTLRNYVFMDINKDQQALVVSGSNEGYNEVWWHYPSANSLVNDRYVIYNYLDNVWYYGTMNRTAWLDSPLRQYPMAAFSIMQSYLAAALNSTDTSLNVINGKSYPASGTLVIDSEQITYTSISGNALLGCTRGANSTVATSHSIYAPVALLQSNQVMDHEIGLDDATTSIPQPIEAYVESSDFDIGDGHNFGYVWRMLPDVSFAGSTTTSPAPAVYLTVKARTNSGTTYNMGDVPAVTAVIPVSADQFTGEVFTRIRGRQMSFKISSTALGVDWQLGATRIDIRPDGRR